MVEVRLSALERFSKSLSSMELKSLERMRCSYSFIKFIIKNYTPLKSYTLPASTPHQPSYKTIISHVLYASFKESRLIILPLDIHSEYD